MCRWLAYSGSPILLQDALYAPAHSLIDQSLHSRLGAETTNGDGFGVGWYGAGDGPAMFRSVEPAWNDANLRELAAHVTSPLFFAHIRASSGTAVQQTNCHPFRHGRWLFMHNGLINDFHAVKRDLVLDVDPSLYPSIEGQTDSEVLFHLALTLGLEDDPPAAVAAAVGLVEAAGAPAGRRASDPEDDRHHGRRAHVGRSATPARAGPDRCSSPPTCRRSAGCTRRWRCSSASRTTTHLIVSEPLGDLKGAWQEVPEASCVVVGGGQGRDPAVRPAAQLARAAARPSRRIVARMTAGRRPS